jgi:hypothetical protein
VDEGGGQHLPEVNVSATEAELVEAVPHLFYACAAKCWTAIGKTVQKLIIVQHNKSGLFEGRDPRGFA